MLSWIPVWAMTLIFHSPEDNFVISRILQPTRIHVAKTRYVSLHSSKVGFAGGSRNFNFHTPPPSRPISFSAKTFGFELVGEGRRYTRIKSSYDPVRRMVVSSDGIDAGIGRIAVTPALWKGSFRDEGSVVLRDDMMSFESSPPEKRAVVHVSWRIKGLGYWNWDATYFLPSLKMNNTKPRTHVDSPHHL